MKTSKIAVRVIKVSEKIFHEENKMQAVLLYNMSLFEAMSGLKDNFLQFYIKPCCGYSLESPCQDDSVWIHNIKVFMDTYCMENYL